MKLVVWKNNLWVKFCRKDPKKNGVFVFFIVTGVVYFSHYIQDQLTYRVLIFYWSNLVARSYVIKPKTLVFWPYVFFGGQHFGQHFCAQIEILGKKSNLTMFFNRVRNCVHNQCDPLNDFFKRQPLYHVKA